MKKTKQFKLYTFCLAILLAFPLYGQEGNQKLRHAGKLIPVDHSVYQVLDLYEAAGQTGFLPQNRPYTKKSVIEYLKQILERNKVPEKEKKVIRQYLMDLSNPVNGLKIKEHQGENSWAAAGARAKASGKIAAGDNATWSTVNIAEPVIAGDIGEHIHFFAGMGASVERLRPDLFHEGYTKNGEVRFPYANTGYGEHPYQFNYETMWRHVNASGKQGGGPPIQDNLTAGMIYHAELGGVWADGKMQVHFHNNRRSWGATADNLILSAHARRFPGIDLVMEPFPWLRYAFLAGSLFSFPAQRTNYKENIYGYDLGGVQKMLTLHMVEFMPVNNLRLTLTGTNIWSKRLELTYLMPLVLLPHLTQSDVGDHDNTSFNINITTMLPDFGKTWFSVLIDEFNFTRGKKKLLMPRNQYAWQVGWKTALMKHLVPGTFSELSYTRVTPFVYTHYPETDFNPLGTGRPLDMTYTHDNANLGFYLPPNSGEFKWHLTNTAVPDLTLEMDNRFIIHGTNDLAGDPHQIFGDIYRHQYGDLYEYPLLDFTNDGIYDYTWVTELRADRKVRLFEHLNYFRLVAAIGYSHTWWESNDSRVTAPEDHSLFTGELGVVVDF